MDIRQAGASDIAALVALMRDFYAEADYPLDEPWAAAGFEALLRQPSYGGVWLAFEQGQPVGHAVLSVRFAMEYGGLSAYIDDLYVVPAQRRRGVARALLQALVADAGQRGCLSLQVEVGDSNEPALSLYAAFGLEARCDGRLLMHGQLPQR
jgi:ribosomal protein S18 acetylase RimI-like enzyme